MASLLPESVTTAIIGKLIETVLDYAVSSWWPNSRSAKAEAERLQAALPRIRSALSVVQGDPVRQVNPDFNDHLWQFRDAIETANDVLDEIKYYELEEKVKAQNSKVSDRLSGCKRKLYDFVHSVFGNDEILIKLREAVTELEAMASDVVPVLEVAKILNQQLMNIFRESGSFFIECSVVGRENEKETIVKWLTTKLNAENEGLLSVFSIVGMGGMGKTTLAQLVCNDQRVINNFEMIVWVCVSDNSGMADAKIMIKKIIEDITKKNCNLDNLNALQDTLKEKVRGRKFLLVVDDVWRDDIMSEWEKMLALLRFGTKGSKILLTTRMESVAKKISGLIKGENGHLNLAGLEEDDFITLFRKEIFQGTNPSEHTHLHKIGDQIAKKLHACPLAAKVIGGVLNNCINYDFWNNILNEDIVNIQESKDYIMSILKLSYYHLPLYLQLCFRYCSIYPQDYFFRKEELVTMWMGSGLIPQHVGNKRPEDVASEYLDQLTRKSFFQVNHDDLGRYYVIHDLLHDLARFASEGECLRIPGDVPIYFPRTIRHLWIEKGNNSTVKQIQVLNKLQTLVINSIDPGLDEGVFKDVLSSLKSLRVLKLNMGKDNKVPNTIGNLIHLRFLFIGSKWIFVEQTNSLCKLYHLEVLRVHCDLDIKKSEIKDLSNLINLRSLEFRCKIKAPWIRKLSSLQELDRFDIENNPGCKIGELKHLVDLHKLGVYGLNNISVPDDAKEAKMNMKKNLKSLVLCWSGNPLAVNGHEKVADNLKPSINLIKLEISYYYGVRSPCWMTDNSCCNLVTVKLFNCYKWEQLPPLGQLSSLEHLELDSMYAVKQVDNSLYGISGDCVFPSLKRLIFRNMPEWEDWIEINDKLFFPCLEELEINDCPKLKRLPTLSSNPKQLKIIKAPLLVA